jgi:hypothetical protein
MEDPPPKKAFQMIGIRIFTIKNRPEKSIPLYGPERG